MAARAFVRRASLWTAGGLGVSVLGYAGLVAAGWYCYGRTARPTQAEADALLDRFMPDYDVVERHHVRVAAAPAITLDAAMDIDLQQSAIVRAIFRARELLLGAEGQGIDLPKGLLAQMTALGWGMLAQAPGRGIVMGAVTRPWDANVVFRAISADDFRAFREPGYVKIAWTLRADPIGDADSIFRTETRVTTTDAVARARFRWYWARFAPGIVLIRRFMLGPLKREAERRQRIASSVWADQHAR